MKNIYTVGQINHYIKNMFAQDFMLRQINIRGEVSNCKYHSSGHIYFSLKDDTGVIKAVMFRGSRAGLTFPMKDGDSVVVTGSVELYERDGVYQLYAKRIEPEGAGDLYLKFEALKKELEEMGMFAPEYKQPLPRYAQTVGIVTAKTGAAIQDIRNIASRRNPYVQLILYPAQVQGEGAAASIVNGIRALDQLGVDIIIVGRGGGSIEDLWAFNEELTARAIFDCRTPIISAVGHETDWTIADFVADFRAPTPSAAAELAVFDYQKAMNDVKVFVDLMENRLHTKLQWARMRLDTYRTRIALHSPEARLNESRRLLADYEDALETAMTAKINDARGRLSHLLELLESVSPAAKLGGGYAYVSDGEKGIKSVADVEVGDALLITLKDGSLAVKVEKRIEQ